jgi:hypothetical protein
MQELRELVAIITRGKMRAIERQGGELRWNAQMQALYQLVADGKAVSDEAARQILYPREKSVTPYNKVKAALKSFLLDKLFEIDLLEPYYHARQRAYFECYKSWATIKIMQGKNARHVPAALAEEVLKIAIKYDFTDVVQEMARTLRLHYGSIEGDQKRHEYYRQLAAKYEDIYQWENISEEFYTFITANYVNSKSTQHQIHNQATMYWLQLKEPIEKYDTYRLQFCGRLIEATIYSSINDYRSTIAICENAIRFFESKAYIAGVPLQAFLYQEMVCYVQLKDYEKGKKAAERGLKLLQEGAYNWFKYQELLLMLSLHAGEYQEAYHLFLAAVRHKKFSSLPSALQEYWRIIEAYLYYLLEVGHIIPDPDNAYFNKFRFAKFINETPIYSKDKRGMNISILIFQILYLLFKKRYDELSDRLEAIEKYSSRYLRRDDTYRSSCFIKMLMQMPSQSFHRVAVIRHAAKHVQMLQRVPLDIANQSHDIEIIPYEDLWEMALQSLDFSAKRTKRG